MVTSRTGATSHDAARRARTDAQLVEAVHAHLQQYGYAKMTIERISAESGVAKTTIYRRWASKAEMVFDLAIHRLDQQEPPIDTGSLGNDIRALSERAVALVAYAPGRDILPGLLADVAGDPDLSARLRGGFVLAARTDIVAMLERAAQRGEIRGEVDIDEFHATLLGVPYAQVHLLGGTDTERIVAQLSAQLLALTERSTTF